MHALLRCTVVAGIAILPCVAFASHRTPGQWQVTSSMHFTQGGPQPIPPEMLARMQAHGMKAPNMMATMGQPHTSRQCLTPEQAAKEDHPDFSQQRCKAGSAAWSGNHFHVEGNCSNERGVSRYVVDGDVGDGGKRINGTGRVEGQSPIFGGHFVIETQFSGQWIGPACTAGS